MEPSERQQRFSTQAGRRLIEIQHCLNQLETLTPDQWLTRRAKIGQLMAAFDGDIGRIDSQFGMPAARERILRYLQARVGQKVSKDEHRGVAGIHEWARRVRELREKHGWAIHSSTTMGDLHPGEYVLLAATPDPVTAEMWTLARKFRHLRTRGGLMSPQDRVLLFLEAVYPRCADMGQLAHVAGSLAEANESLAQLRLGGTAIVTCGSGSESLHLGLRLARRSPEL